MKGKHEARDRSEEIRQEHMLYDILFGTGMFFCGWGLVRCAVVAVNAVCVWLGI